ncbi:MAG: rRNA maturation RNase YbeY [Treponema sp.]|nr:rRNA maturation RNase YbeY [Treponema sp.]
MNNVTINAEEMSLPAWSGAVCGFAVKILDELKCENWELSVLFCGNKTIRNLNNQYRNIDEPTDILSFNLGETVKDGDKEAFLPGDIVISLETLRENAQYFKISEDEELRRLLIHGILHLNGMDHKTIDSDEPMLALQEEILNKLNKEHIIPAGGKD